MYISNSEPNNFRHKNPDSFLISRSVYVRDVAFKNMGHFKYLLGACVWLFQIKVEQIANFAWKLLRCVFFFPLKYLKSFLSVYGIIK